MISVDSQHFQQSLEGLLGALEAKVKHTLAAKDAEMRSSALGGEHSSCGLVQSRIVGGICRGDTPAQSESQVVFYQAIITPERLTRRPVFFLTKCVRENPHTRHALDRMHCTFTNQVEDCTHYVVEKPVKTESFLCSVAAGKWVLMPSFVESAVAKGAFEGEEEHEWTVQHVENNPSLQKMGTLIAACRAQRLSRRGAFESWSVIVCCEENSRAQSFSRVLRCGRCTSILTATTAAEVFGHSGKKVTHILSDDNIWSEPLLAEVRERFQLPVLRMEYLVSCLGAESPSTDAFDLKNHLQFRRRPQ
jgi:topoisomerase (DNA) II binding protein 1